MQGTIKCISKQTLFSMNEANQTYAPWYNPTSEIDYKLVLQEKNNLIGLDNIIEKLKDIKTNVYSNDPINFSDEYKLLNHCLGSLKNILMLCAKIIATTNHINSVPKFVPNNRQHIFPTDIPILQSYPHLGITNCAYVYNDELLLTYFEALLIQSQGLLDKLAIYIQNFKIYNSQDEYIIFRSDANSALSNGTITNLNQFTATTTMKNRKKFYFSTLKDIINQLTTNNQNDKVYKCLKYEIDKNLTNMTDLVISSGQPGMNTLRNKIVHEETVTSLTDNVFVVYRTNKGKIIKFDTPIIDRYPCVMESVSRLLNSIPRLGINTISILINEKYNKKLPSNRKLDFKWKNTFIDYRGYIVDSSYRNKIKLNKFDLALNGFTLNEFYYVKRNLFN